MSTEDTKRRGCPRLSEMAACLPGARLLNEANVPVLGIQNDSRQVDKGHLFVAVNGLLADGHAYIGRALEAGASAVVCETLPTPLPDCPVLQVVDSRLAYSALAAAFYGAPSAELRVTGVTGTDGKTSTTEILRTILNEAGFPAASVGTLGYCIDGRWIDSDLTTPDAGALHRMFGRMLELGMTDACMEVSSHSLVQQRCAHVHFDAAVLTNVTSDHMDLHGTVEAYARAKRTLFESLPPGALAVLPAESRFRWDFEAATNAEVLTYGMDGLADVKGEILSLGMDGMVIDVHTPMERYRLHTGLTGGFNCRNILAAATVAFGFGIGGEAVKEALLGFRGVPGRLERVRVVGRSDLPGVCVDFAHTPDALEKVLAVLRPLVPGKLICVVGCGGERDVTKRPLMGRIATERADTVVFTADNSRSEETGDIIEQMIVGVDSPTADYRVEPDRRRAIEMAIDLAPTPDSMVAVCGRGCERYQKIAGKNFAFDDRVVVRQILDSLPLRRKRPA